MKILGNGRPRKAKLDISAHAFSAIGVEENRNGGREDHDHQPDQQITDGKVSAKASATSSRSRNSAQRILFTAALLIVVRSASHVTLPGVDATVLQERAQANQASNTLFGLYDLFVGGAFSNARSSRSGIMPYISASIILQLLGAVVPYFQKLSKEGEEGRKKMTQLTRYGTVVVAAPAGLGRQRPARQHDRERRHHRAGRGAGDRVHLSARSSS